MFGFHATFGALRRDPSCPLGSTSDSLKIVVLVFVFFSFFRLRHVSSSTPSDQNNTNKKDRMNRNTLEIKEENNQDDGMMAWHMIGSRTEAQGPRLILGWRWGVGLARCLLSWQPPLPHTHTHFVSWPLQGHSRTVPIPDCDLIKNNHFTKSF